MYDAAAGDEVARREQVFVGRCFRVVALLGDIYLGLFGRREEAGFAATWIAADRQFQLRRVALTGLADVKPGLEGLLPPAPAFAAIARVARAVTAHAVRLLRTIVSIVLVPDATLRGTRLPSRSFPYRSRTRPSWGRP